MRWSKRRRPQVERQAERDVAAALVEERAIETRLAVAAFRHVELVGLVARRQRHARHARRRSSPSMMWRRLPGLFLQRFDHLCDLVDAAALAGTMPPFTGTGRSASRPTACRTRVRDRPTCSAKSSSSAIRAERSPRATDIVARSARIYLACGHSFQIFTFLQHKWPDVGVAGKEPEQLARGGLPVDALGGDAAALRPSERSNRSIAPKTRTRADTRCGRAARLPRSSQMRAHQVEILPFRNGCRAWPKLSLFDLMRWPCSGPK